MLGGSLENELYGLDAARNHTPQLLIKLVLLTAQSVSPNRLYESLGRSECQQHDTRREPQDKLFANFTLERLRDEKIFHRL